MSLARTATETPSRRARLLIAGMFIAALFVAYANALHVPFIFDDVPAIASLAKRAVSSEPAEIDAGATTSGRPVVTWSLTLNHTLGGESVRGYHVTNIVIHALAGLTLLGGVRRTLLRLPRWRNVSLRVAIAIAGLWMLHPLQTSAVTYIVQRAESLAGLCLLLTLYCFIRSLTSPRPHGWQTLSVVACLAGMASKETMATAPLVVLAYDRVFAAGGVRRAWVARKGYYWALAATWIVLAALVVSTGGRGGTAGFDTDVSLWNYLLTQTHAIARYAWLAFWPHPLVFDYGTDVVSGVGRALVPGAMLLALAGFTLRGLWGGAPWAFVGFLFFAALAPSSSVVPIASQTIAEHRMYLALIAPVALAVVGVHRWLGRNARFVLATIAVVFVWLTHGRNRTYATNLDLWADTVAKRPTNARAHHNVGLAALDRGSTEAALRHLQSALRLRPDVADTHYNLGLCLMRLGRAAEALGAYQRAVELRPDHAEARNNLGNALLALGRLGEARAQYEHARRLRPDFAEPRSNLAELALRAGEPDTALRHARAALQLKPNLAEAHAHAGNACVELRRFAEAQSHYESALRLNPRDVSAANNLGNVLIETGRLVEAVPHYERALALRPDHIESRRNLALVLLNLGRLADAVPHLEILAKAAPADRAIAEALAQARAAARR